MVEVGWNRVNTASEIAVMGEVDLFTIFKTLSD